MRGLARTACAEFHDSTAFADGSGKVGAVSLQQGGFGSRRIIFRQVGDLLEQF